jgi:hypothetical protein
VSGTETTRRLESPSILLLTLSEVATRRAATPAETVKRTVEARDRMAAFEQIAGSFVWRTFPAPLHGEYKPLPEPARLRQALATWDLQAHRALAGTPTAGNTMLIAQTQAHTAFASQTLLRAAAETGSVGLGEYRTRLEPALGAAQAGWASLARTPLDPDSSTTEQLCGRFGVVAHRVGRDLFRVPVARGCPIGHASSAGSRSGLARCSRAA